MTYLVTPSLTINEAYRKLVPPLTKAMVQIHTNTYPIKTNALIASRMRKGDHLNADTKYSTNLYLTFFYVMCACVLPIQVSGPCSSHELQEESLCKKTKERPLLALTYPILPRNIHIRLHNILYI